jgi:chorismate synthase
MSSFGSLFRVVTFGESHCPGVGCVIEGVPPRLSLTSEQIQKQLNRRRPGQSKLTTPRDEKDRVEIVSGTEGGFTLGTPISLLVRNYDQRPHDYGSMADIPRPSHADLTYQAKYGIRASSGGGRSSARETIGRVAAGSIAEIWLKQRFGTEIIAWVSAVGKQTASKQLEISSFTRDDVDSSPVRCPDSSCSLLMTEEIASALSSQDSVGGIITCKIIKTPVGLGEPVFDKLEALLAHAMLSIPATKGFEIGSGFEGAQLRGSQHNDPFIEKAPENFSNPAPNYLPHQLGTSSNRSGGIQGGIANGEMIIFRVAFKPPATIGQTQPTTAFDGSETVLKAEGRHDPCVVPRAVPIVEAMAALVIADQALQQLARISASEPYPVIGRAPHQ